jgi:hypothetical protein
VTEKAKPGVEVPTPTLPFESTVRAVVVAPDVGSAKTESRERLEREEVALIVKRDAGEVVPMPKKEAMLEIAVVEVAVKLVKVKAPPFVRAKPPASIAEVQGV